MLWESECYSTYVKNSAYLMAYFQEFNIQEPTSRFLLVT